MGRNILKSEGMSFIVEMFFWFLYMVCAVGIVKNFSFMFLSALDVSEINFNEIIFRGGISILFFIYILGHHLYKNGALKHFMRKEVYFEMGAQFLGICLFLLLIIGAMFMAQLILA
jgi:hypothetical protein